MSEIWLEVFVLIFHMDILLFPALFVGRPVVFMQLPLHLGQRNQLFIHVSISGHSLLFTFSSLMPIPHFIDYCGFLISFKIRECYFSGFVLFQIVLTVLSHKDSRMDLRIKLSNSTERPIEILIGIVRRSVWGELTF